MSVIDKKPFIVNILKKLTSAEITTLKGLINGETNSPVFRSLVSYSPNVLTSADKGIKEVKLEIENKGAQRIYNGYLIYKDLGEDTFLCALIAYSSETAQLLSLINITINENTGEWAYEFVPYPLSITELRSELDDATSSEEAEAVEAVKEALDNGDIKIKASNINSESAVSGYALVSDGSGGASWSEVEAGTELPEPTPADTGKFLGVDTNGAYELQNVKTYNRIVKELTTSSGSATFTATSDEWVSGMNNDNTLLEIHDLTTSTYYTLWLTDFDATTLTFTGITNTDKVIATIVKSGSDYNGTFNVSALPTGTQVITLTSSSGTLTNGQFEILSGDNSLLVYKNGLSFTIYSKGYEDSSYIYYEPSHFVNNNNAYRRDTAQISKSNKSYAIFNDIAIQGIWANPTLTGTEAELLGLQIGSTKYKAQSLSQTDGIKCAYATPSDFTIADSYSSYNRCGNILTFVLAFSITKNNATTSSTNVATFSSIPANIFTKLVPTTVGANDYLDQGVLNAFSDTYTNVAVPVALSKGVNSDITLAIDPTNLVVGTTYHLRYFVSFLMTDNLTKIDPILDNNSWADIRAVCEAGEAGDYWNVGDTKSDLGTDGNTRVFRIAHIS